MAAFFTIGEKKTRPGVYLRYENYGSPIIAGVDDGKCSAVIRSNWGPVGEPILLEGIEAVAKVYGNGGIGGTTAVPYEMFRGGARTVRVVRLGSDSDGTKGSLELANIDGEKVLRIVMAHPGSRQFQVVIREPIDSTDSKEFLLVETNDEDTVTVLQSITFEKGENEVDNLISAHAQKKETWFSLIKIGEGTGALAIVDQMPVTPGTDPTITTAMYSKAFEALEPYRWNCIGVDTEDVGVFALLQAYLNRIYQSGKFVMGVIGQPTTIPLATRLTNARSYNDYKIVYVGSGFKDSSGNIYEGYLAAARIAGMIAGTPSNESLTHAAITGATELKEDLLLNEDEILDGLLEAGKFKDDEENYKKIEIRRKGKLLFAFRIRPLSQDEIATCRKKATIYSKPRRYGESRTPIEVDAATFYSFKIYTATVDEDRAKTWDNKKAQKSLDVLTGVDMIDRVLRAGEKERIDDVIDEISGVDTDLEGLAKN